MNGCVYDYRLGRFLSVDPIIARTQALQRIVMHCGGWASHQLVGLH